MKVASKTVSDVITLVDISSLVPSTTQPPNILSASDETGVAPG